MFYNRSLYIKCDILTYWTVHRWHETTVVVIVSWRCEIHCVLVFYYDLKQVFRLRKWNVIGWSSLKYSEPVWAWSHMNSCLCYRRVIAGGRFHPISRWMYISPNNLYEYKNEQFFRRENRFQKNVILLFVPLNLSTNIPLEANILHAVALVPLLCDHRTS